MLLSWGHTVGPHVFLTPVRVYMLHVILCMCTCAYALRLLFFLLKDLNKVGKKDTETGLPGIFYNEATGGSTEKEKLGRQGGVGANQERAGPLSSSRAGRLCLVQLNKWAFPGRRGGKLRGPSCTAGLEREQGGG